MREPFTPLLLATLLLGCQHSPTPLDPDRILHMAGEEAGQIPAPKERLTRQLNIANRETEAGRRGDARDTLRAARDTIEHADQAALDDHDRLAGWISLSELARNADDKAFAGAALDQALAALNDLTPHPARCEYVLGVEREVKALRGNGPAIKLLTDAAEWAVEIPDRLMRRGAFVALAEELFRCDDYDAARAVLRHDPDPAWRSDSLVTMADRARRAQGSGSWGSPKIVGYAAAEEATRTIANPVSQVGPASTQPSIPFGSFGKPLDFKSNYYRP